MISDDVITLTDPTWEPPAKPGFLSRTFGNAIRDERDLPFIRLSLILTVLFVPAAVAMFIPGVFSWWMAPVYWVAYLVALGPFILMLHNTSHRPLFKQAHAGWNRYIPWVNGTLLGVSPETYFAHHMGMHHVDGNLPADLSSTMKYQRDSGIDFLKYFFTFLFLGDYQMVQYFRERKRAKMLKRFLVGEGFYLALTAVTLVLNWQAGVVVFLFPMIMTRLMLMIGNWGQHSFVDHDDPTNDYRTVITFINSSYNHKCFNDGYHLGHHLKASRHWLDMPQDFLDKREEMVKNRSLVFRKLDYFMIFFLVIFKRYKFLARFHVQLDPANPISEEDLIALFRDRVRRFDKAELDAIQAGLSAGKAA